MTRDYTLPRALILVFAISSWIALLLSCIAAVALASASMTAALAIAPLALVAATAVLATMIARAQIDTAENTGAIADLLRHQASTNRTDLGAATQHRTSPPESATTNYGAVSQHNGILINRTPNGFEAIGRQFATIDDARRAIDVAR